MTYPPVLVRVNTEPNLSKCLKKEPSIVGHFFHRRQKSIKRALGLSAETLPFTVPRTEKHTDEHIAFLRLLRKTTAAHCKRSSQENRKVLRCVDGLDEDDVPHETMGQVVVLVIIMLLIFFAWLADIEGIQMTL